jgi:hypothetical protein
MFRGRIQPEVVVPPSRRVAPLVSLLVALAAGAAGPAAAQEGPGPRQAYLRAVADFFQVSRGEIAILAEWDLPAQEIPVALYVAERSGVSPEALVALRRSGRGWSRVASRYHLDASHFHVPLAEDAGGGVLADAYAAYRSRPPREWSGLTLDDDAVVGLVNLRLLSQTLRLPAAEVLEQARPGLSWVEVYASFFQETTSGGSAAP